MPHWMKALSVAGFLCLPLSHGVCQESSSVAVHRSYRAAQSSLEHYRLAESFLQENNLQSAANEFRAALNGNRDAPWTEVWSHIKLGIIFDASGQHDRAVNEYREAQRTGDNTGGALDEANEYLAHGSAVYLAHPPPSAAISGEPVQKIDPEYTDEARLAELEGTVMLRGVIHPEGFVRNLEVAESLGLGLDEKAIEAAAQWQFPPRTDLSAFLIPVTFRLPSKQSRWHLIGVQFNTPPGATRPVFTSALYPIGAGIGPEAIEEGRVLVAIGRLATAKLSFNVDEHGVPVNFQVVNSSEPVWGSEATAVVGQWRFTPAMQNGIAVPVSCSVELVWGDRHLDFSNLSQVRQVLNEPMDKTPEVISDPIAESGAIETTRLRVDEQTQAAKLVVKIPPQYPIAASANGFRGTVRLQVLIAIDGRVRQADVTSGDTGLANAAAEAVKHWVYQPTLLNGTPVEVITEVAVDVGPP